jgi:predicted metal-dependent hydrolase
MENRGWIHPTRLLRHPPFSIFHPRHKLATVAKIVTPRFTHLVFRQLIFGDLKKTIVPPDGLLVGSQLMSLTMVRHPRARRYLLRLLADGSARVTIPRGGSAKAAREFAERHTSWLAGQLQRLHSRPPESSAWQIGSEIFFRGEKVLIQAGADGEAFVQSGNEMIRISTTASDLRPAIERHLRGLAARELPPLVMELAMQHGVTVRRVSVRGQKTRWGSCSRRATISLNWKLVQTPIYVRDYIVLHELMHLRQMNHSRKFWREVESVCPDYQTAENWLKQNAKLLR